MRRGAGGRDPSFAHLPRPVERVDIDAERVLAEPLGIARRLHHDGQDGGPALGSGQLAVHVASLAPGDAEGTGGGADDAGDIDRDLLLADPREGVRLAGVVVERQRAAIGGEVVGLEPLAAQHDRIGRDAADLLDEPREMPGELGIGRIVGSVRRPDGLGLAQLVDLHDPGHDIALQGLPDEGRGKPGDETQLAEGHQPPVLRLDPGRADPVVPGLSGTLVGRFRLRRLAVGGRGPLEHGLLLSGKADGRAGPAAIARAQGMGDGGRTVAEGLRALHPPRPVRRRTAATSGGSRADSRGRGRRSPGGMRSGLASGDEALLHGPRRAAQRRGGGAGTRLGDAEAAARHGSGGARSAARSRPVRARGPAREGRAAARACADCTASHAERRAPGHGGPADGKPGSDGGARAELRAAGDQAVGDSGSEDAEAEEGEGGEDDRHGVLDRGCRAAEACGEFAEEGRADADDDGENQHLHARGDDIAEHAFGQEGGLAEEAEGDQHEARERRQLELDQGDEELDGEDEEGQQDDAPGEHHHEDLHEVLEEGDVAQEIGDGFEDGTTGVDADLGDAARLQELGGGDRAAGSLQAEPGEAIENDPRQGVPVADDVGEDAHEDRLLHEPREDIVVGAPGPEEGGERHVDDDERGGEERDFAAEQPEAGVDIGGEDLQEAVDDTGTAHGSVLPLWRARVIRRIGRRQGGRRIVVALRHGNAEKPVPLLRPEAQAGRIVERGRASVAAGAQRVGSVDRRRRRVGTRERGHLGSVVRTIRDDRHGEGRKPQDQPQRDQKLRETPHVGSASSEHVDGGRRVAGPRRDEAAQLFACLFLACRLSGLFERLRAALGGHQGGEIGQLLRLQRDELIARLRRLQRAGGVLALRDEVGHGCPGPVEIADDAGLGLQRILEACDGCLPAAAGTCHQFRIAESGEPGGVVGVEGVLDAGDIIGDALRLAEQVLGALHRLLQLRKRGMRQAREVAALIHQHRRLVLQ